MIKHYHKRNETLKDASGNQLISNTHVWSLIICKYEGIFFKVNVQKSKTIRIGAVTLFEIFQITVIGTHIKGTHVQIYLSAGWLETALAFSIHDTIWR
jgi:hypothetical protein